VQDAPLVSVIHRLRDDLDVTRRPPGRQRPVAQQSSQILALHVVHRKERLALVFPDFVDGDDVRML
jgi:hypothetical protein